MSKAKVIQPQSGSSVIYQVCSDEHGIPEPAIVVNRFSDVISIEGPEGEVNINYESIDTLIKELKQAKREWSGKLTQTEGA